MIYSPLIRRYARAFLNVFSKDITDQQIVYIENLINYLKINKFTLYYLNISSVSCSNKIEFMDRLTKKFELNSLLSPLIILLIKNRKLTLLGVVLEKIIILYKEQNNIMDFNIVSSIPLSNKETQEIHAFLEKNTDKKINCFYEIDNRLIAGIRATSATFLWERSIAKYLRQIASLRI